MSELYPSIVRWRVPLNVAEVTLGGIRRAGLNGHEGGVLWLGRRGDLADVETVVLLAGRGVREERWHWELSPLVYGAVGAWASDLGQVLLAQAHSHEEDDAIWLSPTDQAGLVRVPDMLAVVIGGFGRVADPDRWGFHVFERPDFRPLTSSERRRRILWSDQFTARVVNATPDGVTA